MLMKGADYKEVIEFMDAQDGSRRENPFEAMTRTSKPTEEKSEEKSEEKTESEETQE